MAQTHYSAFISYRHDPVDTAVAAEVQRKLEHFRIPSQIRKKYGIRGFDRIFRDTSELTTGSDLSAQLDDAIRASDFLIVICSPHYLESDWCLHEIDVFLQTHPRDHVLCVLAEGEPPEIFPSVLMQEAEPLACDYRGKFRDAEKTELPRLACAMIGCSYDELIMREAQYRRRRTSALVSVILSLAAVAVAYLLYSNARIRTAYRQTLLSESKTLSVLSLDAYEARDRYHALSYALEALPSGGLDRPVTSEAVYALHKAAGAYLMPYHIAETRLFDGTQGFEKMVLLGNSGYLAAMDSSANISVYDPAAGSPVSTFSVHSSEILPDLIATEDGLLVTASGGLIDAYRPDGTPVWQQQVSATINNRIHLSPDGSSIGCLDADAVQVMSAAGGEPIASYPIPADTPGYIRDFAWSPDGSLLAVQLRLESGKDRFGLIDTAHGGFTALENEFTGLESFHWSTEGFLLIFCTASDTASFSSGSSYEYLSFRELLVFAYDAAGAPLFTASIPYSAQAYGVESRIIYIGDKPVLLLSAASCLSLLDPVTGDTLLSFDLGESIVRLIDATPMMVRLVTSSGQIATVWYRQGEASLEAEFPDGIRDVLIESGQIHDLDRYFLLIDGNVYLFESTQDESVLLADEPDGGMIEVPENVVICKDSVILRESGNIRFYHLPGLAVTGTKVYEDHQMPRLLGGIPDRNAAAVLVIDMDTGKMQLDLLDIASGGLLASYPLNATEYFCDSGILEMYVSYYDAGQALSAKRMLMESQYPAGPGAICLDGSVLTYHDYKDPDTICRLDLLSGTETTIEPALQAGQTLHNGSFDSSLSPLLPSPDGKMIYSVVQESGHDLRGVLISADTGEIRVLEETESASDLLGAWSHDGSCLAAAAGSSVLLYSADGTLTGRIPYPGSRPLALKYLSDGSLAVFYPNGLMIDYAADGRPLHEVELSYGGLSYVTTTSFRIYETGSYLAVLCQNQLELVDLSVFGARPDVSVDSHALGYDETTDRILVYGFRFKDVSMTYHLGVFARYSVDKLIEKGRAELASIAP